ncbi:MAG: site-2 protease family protein [Planctomycetia bacterium]
MLQCLLWGEPWLIAGWIVCMVVGVSLHELGHALAATAVGDTTARDRGHLTLNPWKHMGPWSLLLLLVFGVGWGLTPVSEDLARRPRAAALVCLAGPLVNLLLALLAAGLYATGARWWEAQGGPGDGLGIYIDLPLTPAVLGFALGNLLLGIGNLLPIPPLDGGRLLATSLPVLQRATTSVWSVVLAVLAVQGLLFLPGAEEVLHCIMAGMLRLWL